jgi:replication-associated recombination protein RarA
VSNINLISAAQGRPRIDVDGALYRLARMLAAGKIRSIARAGSCAWRSKTGLAIRAA